MPIVCSLISRGEIFPYGTGVPPVRFIDVSAWWQWPWWVVPNLVDKWGGHLATCSRFQRSPLFKCLKDVREGSLKMPCGEGTVRHTEEKWVEESVCKVVCLRKTYPKNRYPLYYYVLFIHAVASLGYHLELEWTRHVRGESWTPLQTWGGGCTQGSKMAQ